MQDKSKLGNRYTCFECEKKFYDLNRPEPICPGCGADQRETPSSDPRVAVMARYKGNRITSEQAAPSKDAIQVDDTEEVSTAAAAESEEDGAADAADAAPEGDEKAPAAEKSKA